MKLDLEGIVGLAILGAAFKAAPKGTPFRAGLIIVAIAAGFAGVWLFGDVLSLGRLGLLVGPPVGLGLVYWAALRLARAADVNSAKVTGEAAPSQTAGGHGT
jgi:hypothetical protein